MAKEDIKEIECIVPNVWTSNGKIVNGERDIVPAAEAKALEKAKSVKIVRQSK